MSNVGRKSEVTPPESYESNNVETTNKTKESEETYSPVFAYQSQPYCYKTLSNENGKSFNELSLKDIKAETWMLTGFPSNFPLKMEEVRSSTTERLKEIQVAEQSFVICSYEKINSSEENIAALPNEYARSIDRIHEGTVENGESKTEVQQDVWKEQKHTGNWQELEFNNETDRNTKIKCLNANPFDIKENIERNYEIESYVENNTGTREPTDCNFAKSDVPYKFENDSLSNEENTVKSEDYRKLRCNNSAVDSLYSGKQTDCPNRSNFRMKTTIENKEGEDVHIMKQLRSLIQQLEQQSPLWKPLGGNTNKVEEISNYIQSLQKQNAELSNQINMFTAEVGKHEALRQNAVFEDKHKLEEKLAGLQKLLEENKTARKVLEQKCKNLEKSLNKEHENKSRFKLHLREVINPTRKTDNVDKHLQKISNMVAEYSKPFSKQEMSEKAEEEFIRSSLQKIQNLEHNAKEFEDKIKSFRGDRKDKTYLHIKEMLFRAIEELDNVESEKKEEILKARRNVIDYVKRLWDDLEKRVK